MNPSSDHFHTDAVMPSSDQYRTEGPATRNDFVNDIDDDARADAIFATLNVDDGSSTISLRVAGP